ncbi:hypothetical protein EDC01DRAFT_728237 [Geopyxis carbonaria]|nr:hypothetical protein EDC01DRAFT_728237 [Geopyxis carbonaria]
MIAPPPQSQSGTATRSPSPSPIPTSTPAPAAAAAPDTSSLASVCAALNTKLTAFLAAEPTTDLQRRVQAQTASSLGIISTALDRYSIDELAISYNGGKDCLVLLLLFLCALARHPRTSAALPARIRSVYVMSSHPFTEVDEFVDASVGTYMLDLARYALPMKLAFETYLREQPAVRAVFVGTRRTDPHGAQLGHFDMTDHGWPSFMRVHPVIDWHYQEVWGFLRALEIPYCRLYDMGYTSLGGTTDTHPNPVLLETAAQNGGDKATPHFRPAYELVEDQQERLGRDR